MMENNDNAYNCEEQENCADRIVIDSTAIANASAAALNGANGKDVCKTLRYAVGVAGIVGLTWIFEKQS